MPSTTFTREGLVALSSVLDAVSTITPSEVSQRASKILNSLLSPFSDPISIDHNTLQTLVPDVLSFKDNKIFEQQLAKLYADRPHAHARCIQLLNEFKTLQDFFTSEHKIVPPKNATDLATLRHAFMAGLRALPQTESALTELSAQLAKQQELLKSAKQEDSSAPNPSAEEKSKMVDAILQTFKEAFTSCLKTLEALQKSHCVVRSQIKDAKKAEEAAKHSQAILKSLVEVAASNSFPTMVGRLDNLGTAMQQALNRDSLPNYTGLAAEQYIYLYQLLNAAPAVNAIRSLIDSVSQHIEQLDAAISKTLQQHPQANNILTGMLGSLSRIDTDVTGEIAKLDDAIVANISDVDTMRKFLTEIQSRLEGKARSITILQGLFDSQLKQSESEASSVAPRKT